MEASRALTYKLLKTHVLGNTNETLIEEAPLRIQTHTKPSDFNVPLPVPFTPLFMINHRTEQ